MDNDAHHRIIPTSVDVRSAYHGPNVSQSRRVARGVEQDKKKKKKKVRLLMGGVNVKQSDAPFSVHLHYSRKGVKGNCAGTMISDRHVLTAAHCFVHKNCELRGVSKMLDAKGWKVYYGGGCLPFAKDACSKFQQIARSANVRSIAIPNDYLTGPCYHNDIAIVTVKLKMAPLNDVACVAQPEDKLPNVFALYARGSDPRKMKKVTSLATVNLTRIDCLPEVPIPGIKADQLCTSEWDDMNMCKGDSGAGLMFRSGGNKPWNIAGVASAGSDCQIIETALSMKKASKKEAENIALDGSIFIDVRQHSQFLCEYIGLCYKELQKGVKRIKAVLL